MDSRRTRRPPRFGLATRIAISFALLLTFVAGVYSVAFKMAITFTEVNVVGDFLEEDFEFLREHLEAGKLPPVAESTEIYGTHSPLLKPIPERYAAAPNGYYEVEEEPAVFVWRGKWSRGDLMVVRSQGDFEIREEALKSQVYASLIFVFILGAGAGWLLIRQVMRPVRELSGAVRQRAEAESWAPLDPDLMTEDEVGELARICDEALKRFHEALQRERTFTRDASHELRTPLTVIETSAELLELAALPEAQRRQVERILRASADMRGLITVFLQLARAPSLDPNRMPSDTVAGILSWSAAVWKPEAERRGMTIEIQREAECPGRYSPVMLGTVVNNIVRNAVAYAGTGRITLTETARGFIISDEGPGIAPESWKDLSEVFHRGKSAEKSEGWGLGLAIVGRIARVSGWTVRLLSSEKGARIEVEVVPSEAPVRYS